MTLYLTRSTLILMASASLAACATYEPFGETTPEATRPVYATRMSDAPVATPPPGARADAPVSLPQASPTVESQILPPPGPRPLVVTPSTPPYPGPTPPSAETAPPPPPRYDPPPPPPPEPRIVMQTITKTTITGKVVDADGPPKVYTVKSGDNLSAIARKLDTTADQLAKDNKLKEPYLVKPGQELKGPQSKAKAYVVGQGDTLYGIARRFSVTAVQIAEANEMELNAPLKSGKKLILPEGFKDKGPTKSTVTIPVEAPPSTRPTPNPAPTPVVTPPPVVRPPVVVPPPVIPPVQPQPQPVKPPPVVPKPVPVVPPRPQPTPVRPPVIPAPSPGPVVPTTGPLTESQISALGRGRFNWPLRGDVISDFGPKGTGQRNDGLNIRARAGEPVRSAADGDVVYAGDQVPGFGNLVLVKHADGWVTAYGHLARVDVKMQQKVAQGQQLGQAGASGGVSEPQLHFEVRFAPSPADRARPIDPRLVLGK